MLFPLRKLLVIVDAMMAIAILKSIGVLESLLQLMLLGLIVVLAGALVWRSPTSR